MEDARRFSWGFFLPRSPKPSNIRAYHHLVALAHCRVFSVVLKQFLKGKHYTWKMNQAYWRWFPPWWWWWCWWWFPPGQTPADFCSLALPPPAQSDPGHDFPFSVVMIISQAWSNSPDHNPDHCHLQSFDLCSQSRCFLFPGSSLPMYLFNCVS